jgi:HEAT repeat protein
VRKRAVEILDEMVAKDSVAAVIQLAQSDPDEQVRIVSCHALGNFGNSSATTALNAISTNDSSQLVRDMASIALRRL